MDTTDTREVVTIIDELAYYSATVSTTQEESPDLPRDTRDLVIAETLNGAALYIQRRGWNRGYFLAELPSPEAPFPAACAIGAIRMAVTGTADWDYEYDFTPDQLRDIDAAIHAVALWVNPIDYIKDDGDNAHELVATWNDDTYSTANQVMKVLRAIADDHTQHKYTAARTAGYLTEYLAKATTDSTTGAQTASQ
jgi:hypothetical protein